MKSFRLLVPAWLAALALTGCATNNIKPTYQMGTDFARYHTFAVLPVNSGQPATQPGLTPAFAAAAQAAATEALSKKGLREVSETAADLLVSISGEAVSLNPDYQHRTAFTSQGLVNVYYVNSSFPQIQTRCALVVELIDRTAGQVVWQAAQSDTLLAQPDRETVALSVKNILAAYPPGPASAPHPAK